MKLGEKNKETVNIVDYKILQRENNLYKTNIVPELKNLIAKLTWHEVLTTEEKELLNSVLDEELMNAKLNEVEVED